MQRSAAQLREDALAIWRAGVDAVRGDRLVAEIVRVENRSLWIADTELPLDEIQRIAVVGAGKAGASMAAGLEAALGDQLMRRKGLTGWINVPADCIRPLKRITLHAARPAGVNEPTAEGVAGAQKILELVESLQPRDLCLCLISGGGSALLPAPVEGVTLTDKQAVTRFLSDAGANIQQLNTVRKQLSHIKGGGLARRCRAARLISLIISDVLGDPLDVIASGPTVEDSSTAQDALDVLQQFNASRAGVATAVFDYLRQRSARPTHRTPSRPDCQVSNVVIGNNAVAVDAAGMEAERRGYSHAMIAENHLEGPAEEVGRHLAGMALRMREEAGPDCLISGGEPIVKLIEPERRGKGGRNQQLVLAALETLLDNSTDRIPLEGIVLLSGGTDGEDGPTDAAGALADASLVATMQQKTMQQKKLDASDYLARNDAYRFFEPLGGLIKTGPTHTNVCDVRVVVVDRIESAPRGR